MTADERRGGIADVATKLFAQHGFSGVTTRQIAQEAGVNEALLYRHFPNKEALYTEIIKRKIEAEGEILDLSILEGDDDRAVLTSVATSMMAQVRRDKTFLRLLFFSALEDHRLSSMFFQSRMKIGLPLMKYFERRMRDGIFRKVEPRIAIRAFMGMLFHYIITTELFSLPKMLHVSREEAIKNFVEIFLKGMEKR